MLGFFVCEENVMSQEQGFLIQKDNGKIVVNSKKTTSILTNQLQVDFLIDFSFFLKGNLLDVGCGEKPYKLIYDDLCEKSIGIDVETCKHEQKWVDIFASADNMPFDNEIFDSVLCTNVLEHVADMEAAFSEIRRVLKKGGYAIISVPFLYPVHESPYDYYRFTRHGLEYQLVKNGFEIERIISWGGVGLLSIVYFNMFFGKVLNNKLINALSCFIQKGFYILYRAIFYGRIKEGKGKIHKVITLGNFIITKKQ